MAWILLYGDTENPHGVPPEWPAEVKTVDTPQPAPWIEMTVEEYNDYRDLHRPAYEAWHEEAMRLAEEKRNEEQPMDIRELALSLAEVLIELSPDRVPEKVKKEVQDAKDNADANNPNRP